MDTPTFASEQPKKAQPAAPEPSSSRGAYLLFSLGGEPYRIPLARLEGVVPWADLRPAAHSRRGVLGYLLLEGREVPVIDPNQLLVDVPTPRHLGSRILLLRCARPAGSLLVGVLASDVFDTASEAHSAHAETLTPCETFASVLSALEPTPGDHAGEPS